VHMDAPTLIKPIPDQVVNEQAAYYPFDLKEFIVTPEGSSALRFEAVLKSGESLPVGVICTSDGILTGIPAKETEGRYEVVVTASNELGSVSAEFIFLIKPTFAANAGYVDELKAQIWEALDKSLPIPDVGDLMDRPINILEVYYLLERWGSLKIWDAFNLEPPGELKPLKLEGASEHYAVYDRGSCLVATPVDLYSHERTIEDGLRTARAMAREVYKRDWTIEMAGFDKLTRAVWVEAQHLGDKHGKRLEIINFTPMAGDLEVYMKQVDGLRGGLER
jgi:hypothetical protein